MDIRKKLKPESVSDMMNSRQRKRMIRMNEMSMERGTKMLEGEMQRRTRIEVDCQFTQSYILTAFKKQN